MSAPGPILTNDDLAALTLADKLSLVWALWRGYGLTVWALIMAGGLALGFLALILLFWHSFGSPTMIDGSNDYLMLKFLAGKFFWLFLLMLVFSLLMQIMLVGLNTLVLLYIDNKPPASAASVFLSPWARFGPIILCLLLWLALSIPFHLAQVTLGQISGLGFVIELPLTLAYSIVSNCAMFYIADKILRGHEKLSPVDAVLRPLAIVANNPLAWLSAAVFILAIYLPLAAITLQSLVKGGLIVALGGGLGLTAASVFLLFLFGVTYRQTLAQYGLRATRLH